MKSSSGLSIHRRGLPAPQPEVARQRSGCAWWCRSWDAISRPRQSTR